jgi:hypothetical protein
MVITVSLGALRVPDRYAELDLGTIFTQGAA